MHDTTYSGPDGHDVLTPAKRRLLERLTGAPGRQAPEALPAIERRLEEIWARVLGCRDFGLEDDFFKVGGDSILVIRLRNLVLEELGVAFEVQQFYERPTIRELAGTVHAQRAGAEAVLAAGPRDAADAEMPRVALPDGVIDAYPMSEMQKGMAFHAELRQRESAYVNHGAARIDGAWSLPSFLAALDALIRRHEILRTGFDFTSYSEPMQLVHPPRRAVVTLVDLGADPVSHAPALRKVRTSMHRRPFRLHDYPLLRVVCVRETGACHHLAHAHHHAILDGWSLNLLFRELWADYATAGRGLPIDKPPIRTAYKDFVRAERAALASESTRRYWRSKLERVPRSRFPADPDEGPAAPDDSPWGTSGCRSVSLPLPSDVLAALRGLGEAERVHLSTVLLAGHTLCVGALLGVEQVTTGRVVNGRPETLDGDAALGLFVNTCVHAVDVGVGTWIDLLRRTAAEERASHPHRRYPVGRLQEVFGPGEPVDTLFVFENYHMHAGPTPVPWLRITGRDYAVNNVKLVASFVWSPDRSRLDLTLYGLQGAVPGWLLRRAARWYLRAFRSFAASPQSPARIESIFTLAEIHQQAIEWNDTAGPLPATTLPADFERWAATAPDEPALIAADGMLTYAELNRRANRLAHCLARAIGRTDAPVAVLLEPGEEQVVAVLAAVKAGFAYLPLDVSDPPERVRYALAEAGAPAVLTRSDLCGRFQIGAARALEIDRLQAAVEVEPSDDPGVEIAGHDPLYVIFTSGSTGAPKAVRLNHRGRANNFHDFLRRFGIGRGDRVLALSNLTFDMSAFDILGTLAAGAAIVAPTPPEKKDPLAWVRLIARHRVTVWHSAPALLRMLLDARPPDGQLQSLRLALLGGDWIPLDLPDRLKRVVPHVEVVSLGGATEVSMDSTVHRIGERRHPLATVPYGRPMANQKAFVLGPRLQPAPAGVAGELYLGGVGVGDGYVNRPDLTACRFLPNPYPETAGERVYKTGDQARHLRDGTLELLGRRDFQIKIRGFRIEPAEVEKTLLAFSGVEKAVVVAKSDRAGERRLVAYVVPPPGVPCGDELKAEIRGFVKSRLPAYLQPSRFVLLDRLPLTPNGKVDRRALPDPERDAVNRRAPVAPRDDWERAVLDAWRRVLRTTDIGVEDDFFECGGDSVSATQIVSRLRLVYGTDISLAMVFDYPTVAEQARQLAGLPRRSQAPSRAV